MTTIKTWQERAALMSPEQRYDERTYMRDEIAALRAALTVESAALADAVRHVGNLKEQRAALHAQQGDAPASDCRMYCQREADEAAKPKCKGCNGHGMVGNILDSDTCPFCKGSGTEDGDALDAARYRWLRDSPDSGRCIRAMYEDGISHPKDVDELIDAGLAALAARGEG